MSDLVAIGVMLRCTHMLIDVVIACTGGPSSKEDMLKVAGIRSEIEAMIDSLGRARDEVAGQ